MARRNIKLIIAYDGSSYHGWQRQPSDDTIQQQLETAIERLTGQKISITGASRTDAGVSALGQVANFRIDSPIPTENFAGALNSSLPEEIAVCIAEEASDSFEAIRCAKGKLYRYTICTSPIRPVLKIRQCWHYPYLLDAGQMDKAAKLIVGKRDFKSFASAGDTRQSSVRTVTRCDVIAQSDGLFIEVEGDGFLYNMVRIIVGTLLEVGVGRRSASSMHEVLASRDRAKAGRTVEGAGLTLVRVDYADASSEDEGAESGKKST